MIPESWPVLDRGYVELLDTMPGVFSSIDQYGVRPLDLAVVQAARVTHMEGSKGADKDRRLIAYLMKHEHTSPFEQVQLKWRIKAPMLVWWQWVRHRTFHFQSINSQSGRYTEFAEDEFYVPNQWRRQSQSNHQGSDGTIDDEQNNEALYTALDSYYASSYQAYKMAVDLGVARELARLFLGGFGVYYTWIVSVNLHNLFQFLRLRLADDAQEEIRRYALGMHRILRPHAPLSFEAFEENYLGLSKVDDLSRRLSSGNQAWRVLNDERASRYTWFQDRW